MLGLRRTTTLQKFSSVQGDFNEDRNLISRDDFKARRSAAFAESNTLAARPWAPAPIAPGEDKLPSD